MRNRSIYLTFCAMVLSILSYQGFAADSMVDLPGFTGFRVQSLAALKESGNPFHRSLVDFYKDSGALLIVSLLWLIIPKQQEKLKQIMLH